MNRLSPRPGRRRPGRLGHIVAATASGLAVVGLTSGCMVFSPVQTNDGYQPADGVEANIGSLAVRDLLLVGGAGSSVVSGSLVNEGRAPVTVRVQPQASDGSVADGSELELAAKEQVDLAGRNLVFGDVVAKPGTNTTLRITATPGGTTIVSVPVLAANRYLSTVTPAPTAPEPTPAPTPTATAPAAPKPAATSEAKAKAEAATAKAAKAKAEAAKAKAAKAAKAKAEAAKAKAAKAKAKAG